MKTSVMIFAVWLIAVQYSFAQICEDGSSPVTNSISVGSMNSWDNPSDPNNEIVKLCGFASNGNMVGLEWSGIDFSPIGDSYCSEIIFQLQGTINLRPAIGENNIAPCTNGYSGGEPGILQDLGLNFPADTDGCVSIEIAESFDDDPDAIDATIDAGTITMTGCPQGISLPIELIEFSAIAVNEKNLIKWTTANEYNSAWHIIERSPDGRGGWLSIGQLPGSGESTVPIHYEMEDPAPLPISYYRLKETSFSGQITYSHVISVKRPTDNFVIQAIAPNPATDMLRVEYGSLEGGEMILEIFDQTGKLIKTENFLTDAGAHQKEIYVGQLPTGAYQLILQKEYLQERITFLKK